MAVYRYVKNEIVKKIIKIKKMVKVKYYNTQKSGDFGGFLGSSYYHFKENYREFL